MTDPVTTIREALEELTSGPGHMPYDLWVEDRTQLRDEALVALTELEQQQLARERIVLHVDWQERAEAAEDDRDQYKREFDKLMDNALNATERYTAAERERDKAMKNAGRVIESHARVIEERDQLADTLREIADGPLTTPEIARAARAALDQQEMKPHED